MSYDDIVYLTLLFSSIGFGYIYRQIKDKDQRKLVGTVVGLIIVFIVSGLHIVHSFITYFVNAAIILFVSKRQCHLASFIFSFLYLFFFRSTIYFGIPYPPAHTNLVQMMLTLKLVGLAFEVNTAYLNKNKAGGSEKTVEEKLEDESNNIDPNPIDIFHYTFNYVGVLTGPYYRYRTFRDSLELPFSSFVSSKDETLKKMTYIPLYAILFLLSSYIWPLSYALTEEFDAERSWLYRLWYVWPNFFTFRMRIYIGLVLSECVCTMAGIGAYPLFTEPKSGHGPSINFQDMMSIAEDSSKLTELKYDFETIHNINPYGSDFCTTFREAIKNWNICIQYWLAVNVYKRFPSKKYRTVVTMTISAVWHGVYTGYYVCIGGAPFYMLVEDVYIKLLLKDNSGTSLKICEWIMWFFKMFGFSYLAIAFHLLSLERILHYYNSIYHAGLIMGIVFYIVGLQLLKAKRAKDRRNNSTNEIIDKKEN